MHGQDTQYIFLVGGCNATPSAAVADCFPVTIVVAFGIALRVAESFTSPSPVPTARAAITYSASASPYRRALHRPVPPNLGKNDERKPVLDSVERRRLVRRCARTSRGRCRTVGDRGRKQGSHEPRPEGGFTRSRRVITALLTMAEVTAAEWVACARRCRARAGRAARSHSGGASDPRRARLHYVTPPGQYEQYTQ